jgi:hypothetical protein
MRTGKMNTKKHVTREGEKARKRGADNMTKSERYRHKLKLQKQQKQQKQQ